MTAIDNRFRLLGYIAITREATVYDISKVLSLDSAYVHRMVKKLVDEGLLIRCDPIRNEKGAPTKPIRLTLHGLQEIFCHALSAARKSKNPYHTDTTGELRVGTRTIRSMIAHNQDLHPALHAYLCLFDTCAEEFFQPEPEQEEAYQNVRWVSTLTMMIEALVTALPPGTHSQFGSAALDNGGLGHPSERKSGDATTGRETGRDTETSTMTDFDADSFGADLFLEMERVVLAISRHAESEGRGTHILQYFSDEILPLCKPFEDAITARIMEYEKRAAHLQQIRHQLALIDAGSFECSGKTTSHEMSAQAKRS
ncbi:MULTISPECIES: MarR family transcriptional regulator [Methanocalculus]|uniref:MarR family transcriptional regulator n=1 Tax=Methanocalculus TaxID=71151 RepID=UPI00209C78AC|nr:MarR family transcriptional regulator [Methanocalculus sp. AMF5]MCP1662002.1 DNA-binding MarR family transcriptional regulator [Methanocalculus sp. AMF5]